MSQEAPVATPTSTAAQQRAARQAALTTQLPRDYPAASRPQTWCDMPTLQRDLHVTGASIATWHGWELDWAAGFGSAQPGVAVTTGTLFQAGSISKPVAALMAMRLVERGLLDLDADINAALTRWQVPAVGDWQPRVTLRHLLSHTAGFTYCWYPGYQRGVPLPDVVETLRGGPLSNTPAVAVETLPGLVFRYAGGHYSALQLLLEEVTATPFVSLAQELIFDPLGVRDTSYDVDIPAQRGDAASFGHDFVGDPLPGGARVLPEAAAAGIWSTPSDLLTIIGDVAAAIAGRPARLLQPETARQMTTAQVGGYALGWRVNVGHDPNLFGHGGANIGFLNTLLFNYATGDGLAVMTNAERGSELRDRVVSVAATTYPGLAGAAQTEHDRHAALPASHVLPQQMAGTWQLESGAALQLTTDGDSHEVLLARVDTQPAFRLERSGPRAWQAGAHDLAISLATTLSPGGVPRVQVRTTGATVHGVRLPTTD